MKSSTSEPGLRVIIIVAANDFNIYDCNMNLTAGYLDWLYKKLDIAYLFFFEDLF